MQTARRQPERSADIEQTASDPKAGRSSIGIAQTVLCGIVLASYCFFFNMMEGLNGDTVFLALFCTGLTMFIFLLLGTILNNSRDTD